MLPVLKYCGDKEEHSTRDIYEHISQTLNLSTEDLKELVPSGQQTLYENRLAWAKTYLKKAGLLTSPRRGIVKITERGLFVLKDPPPEIDNTFLMQYSEFQNFKKKKSDQYDTIESSEIANQITPFELLENGFQQIRNELASDILEQLKDVSPSRFEQIVVELIVKMGYGGTLKDAGQALGRSGDGGIDGIIKEDRLGLDAIYIQAKRWEGTVSRPEVQKFIGALQMQQARKGIFITTSSFTKEALNCVNMINTKVVLIDGEQLAQYMIDSNVGVSTVSTYEVKKIDSDFFNEE